MTRLKAEDIRGMTEFLRRDQDVAQNRLSGRALDIMRVLRERGKLTPFELGGQLKGVSLRELEDALNALDKLGLIERMREGDQEFIMLSERGAQVAASLDLA